MDDLIKRSYNLFWLPFKVDTFDDPRIKNIEKLKDGYMIICMLLKLWCLAAKANNDGVLEMPGGIVYSEDTLAVALGIRTQNMKRVIEILIKYKFLLREEGVFIVNNWSDLIKYVEEQERKRQKHKEAQERYREKEKNKDKEKQHLAPYHKEFKDTEEPKKSVPMPDSMKARYQN